MSTDFVHQRSYWDQAAGEKTFTHPLDRTLLTAHVGPTATILDYGCGYGRLSIELHEAGFGNVIGVDFSHAMVARARAACPELTFEVTDGVGLPLEDNTVDAVLLFAVLTCIPSDEAQQGLIAEIARVLRPGGIAYVSDYLLQTDERNTERYAKFAKEFGNYGVFLTDDGALVRHHTSRWLDTLFAGFQRETQTEVELTTMNGHRSIAFQFIVRKPCKPAASAETMVLANCS
ncbi:MAG: class I SAM-dependent methyltransferase [Telluria sp.]